MIAPQLVRRYAHNQQISIEVADQEIVLHYALALLNDAGLVGRRGDGSPAPLLFKGGTALRKCLFGTLGRFSQDIDLDAPHRDGFETEAERAFVERAPFHGIVFGFENIRWSDDENENFSGTVAYRHEHGDGRFELQISYRLHPVLDPRDLPLVEQEYMRRAEMEPPALFGLDPYEMIGEKIMACNRRQGGSAKDVYDLYLWSARPFGAELVRRIAVLKAWTDQRRSPAFSPDGFLAILEPGHFRGKTSTVSSRAANITTASASARKSASASRSSARSPTTSANCSPTRPPIANGRSTTGFAKRRACSPATRRGEPT